MYIIYVQTFAADDVAGFSVKGTFEVKPQVGSGISTDNHRGDSNMFCISVAYPKQDGAEIMGDIPNFTNIQPTIQVDEVVA